MYAHMTYIHHKNGIILTQKYVRRSNGHTPYDSKIASALHTHYRSFCRSGEFATRSEVIRRAVNEFVKNYADSLIEKAEKIKKVQELENALDSIEPYMKK